MQEKNLERWRQGHSFGQDVRRPGEFRTIVVIVLTSTMMVVEIVAGQIFGSMALLADGLHMASHTAALSISAGAYVYARRHAHDTRFSFGTGKVNSLAGFTGAILLGLFAVLMVWESVQRILHPIAIAFNEAILVAVVGLVVNGASVFILGHGQELHHHDGETGRSGSANGRKRARSVPSHHDHNLRSAYLHVLADALTSLLAIFALFAAKWFGAMWMDPLMGIVGAILVGRWALGLVWVTSSVLLDREAPQEIVERVRNCIEDSGVRIADLHLWVIAPARYAAIVSVVAEYPESPLTYKAKIPGDLGLAHITIEVNRLCDAEDGPTR
jgi:cation diffusion facilitator family transporter